MTDFVPNVTQLLTLGSSLNKAGPFSSGSFPWSSLGIVSTRLGQASGAPLVTVCCYCTNSATEGWGWGVWGLLTGLSLWLALFVTMSVLAVEHH